MQNGNQKMPAKEVYGPTMPPKIENEKSKSIDKSSQNYGPSLPPTISKKIDSRAVYGPTMPSQPTSNDKGGTIKPNQSDGETISKPKSVYGPLPSHIPQSPPKMPMQAPETIARDEKTAKREDWMLVPPEANRLTKDVKSRGFRKGGVPTVDSTSWTKRPGEEKEAPVQDIPKKSSMKDVEYRKYSEQHNVKFALTQAIHRPIPLIEQHKVMKNPGVDSKRFDRERDFSTQSMSSGKAQNIITKAKELNSKFSHGTSDYL